MEILPGAPKVRAFVKFIALGLQDELAMGDRRLLC